jgi:flagellar hook-associated protein 3 FlgL
MFQVAQNLISALQTAPADAASNAQFQQQIENAIAGIGGAQTSALSAQATIGSVLSEIQAVQGQDTTQNTNAQAQLSDLQSANLPQVIANYSESVTALQAAQLAFAKVQGLSLFDFIQA